VEPGPIPLEEVKMIMFRTARTVLGAPLQLEPEEMSPRDFIDKLQALQKENKNLQQLVCYLLQKNELLRREAGASRGEN
jgi:hypothetical protein